MFVDNDANLGALAELWWGAGSTARDLAYIKVATGIGAGLIIDGRIFRGSGGIAGEIGHTSIDPNGPQCVCGLKGCLTTFIGTPALLARAKDRLRASGSDRPPPAGIDELVNAALDGDPMSVELIRYAGDKLGVGIANMLNLLNPEMVILGGGIARAGPSGARRRAQDHSRPVFAGVDLEYRDPNHRIERMGHCRGRRNARFGGRPRNADAVPDPIERSSHEAQKILLYALTITLAVGPFGTSCGSSDNIVSPPERWVLTMSDEFDGDEGTPPNSRRCGPTTWAEMAGATSGSSSSTPTSPENVSLDGAATYESAQCPRRVLHGQRDGTPRPASRPSVFSNRSTAGSRRVSSSRRARAFGPRFGCLAPTSTRWAWPDCGEIDIMEYQGQRPSRVFGSLHGPGYSGGEAISGDFSLPDGETFADDFHVFAVEWDPSRIRFSVDDGEPYQTVRSAEVSARGKWVFDHEFFVILNLAVGGTLGGPVGPDTVFPAEVRVDYVRIFERRPVTASAAKHYETAPEDRISLPHKLIYGLGGFVNNLLAAASGGMMIVLNLGLGMSPWLVGMLGALPRLTDALTDPLMGYISDHTRSKWGRRRPYIFVGRHFGRPDLRPSLAAARRSKRELLFLDLSRHLGDFLLGVHGLCDALGRTRVRADARLSRTYPADGCAELLQSTRIRDLSLVPPLHAVRAVLRRHGDRGGGAGHRDRRADGGRRHPAGDLLEGALTAPTPWPTSMTPPEPTDKKRKTESSPLVASMATSSKASSQPFRFRPF